MAKRRSVGTIRKILDHAEKTNVKSAAERFGVRQGQIYLWRKRFVGMPTASARTMITSGKLKGRVNKTPMADQRETPTYEINLTTSTDNEPATANDLKIKRLQHINDLLKEKIFLVGRLAEVERALTLL